MYHKAKNTLTGIVAAAAFLVGGALFSDPAPAEIAQPARVVEDAEAELALAVVRLALQVAKAELVSEARGEAIQAAQRASAESRARASRVKLELGMPYYSFGTALPRRAES